MKKQMTATSDWAKIKIMRNPKFNWTENEKGVVIEMPRDTFIDKICQRWFKVAKSSKIQLDELGSFFWKASDGSLTVKEIADKMQETFGENAKDSMARASKFAVQLHKANFAQLLIRESEIEKSQIPNPKSQ